MGLFNQTTRPPIWFMRQAGRYHTHYQLLRSSHDFDSLCKNPKLACEVTLGPIEEFDFDAAILFSDLLFPLEYLGLGLSYRNGPPQLAFKLDSLNKIKHLRPQNDVVEFFQFQKNALLLLKEKLPKDVTLLGFVGSPWTLFTYAVDGGHSGGLVSPKMGLIDGRFDAFLELIIPLLITNICLQIEGGSECICIFDTAAGELDAQTFNSYVRPGLEKILSAVKNIHPNIKIHYYAKFAQLEHLQELNPQLIDILGIDWRWDLLKALDQLGDRFMIQGNLDPSLLFWPWKKLEAKIMIDINRVNNHQNFKKWIFSLGHGVLPQTPQDNVQKCVQLVKNLQL